MLQASILRSANSSSGQHLRSRRSARRECRHRRAGKCHPPSGSGYPRPLASRTRLLLPDCPPKLDHCDNTRPPQTRRSRCKRSDARQRLQSTHGMRPRHRTRQEGVKRQFRTASNNAPQTTLRPDANQRRVQKWRPHLRHDQQDAQQQPDVQPALRVLVHPIQTLIDPGQRAHAS